MGLKKDALERQLKLATEKLESRSKALDEKGVASENRSKDSAWRSLDADRRAIINRINAANELLAREEEIAQKKAAAASE